MDSRPGQRLRELPGPILLTGHTGFKGTWLTLLLESLEIPVAGLSLPPLQNSLFLRADRVGKIKESFIDAREYTAVEKFVTEVAPSVIIHLAAQPLVVESYRSPRETFATNVLGTVNVLDAAFASPSVEAVGVVTTDKVYRNDDSGNAFVETDPLTGKDPYSASKVGAESAVAAWQQIGKISGGPKVVALRAGNVIGGGDWATDRLLPDLVRGFSAGDTVKVRNPESTRPWQHVLDPLVGYLMALENLLRGGEFPSLNFGPSDASLKVREVVEIARQCWPNPTKVSYEGSENKNSSEATSLQLDAKLAHSLLGWKMAWSQADAVSSTIEWWRDVLINEVPASEVCMRNIEKMLGKK